MKKVMLSIIMCCLIVVACTPATSEPGKVVSGETTKGLSLEVFLQNENGEAETRVIESIDTNDVQAFEKIYQELAQLEQYGPVAAIHDYKLTDGNKYIITIGKGVDLPHQPWTYVYLSEDEQTTTPTRKLEKDTQIYQDLMMFIERLEETKTDVVDQVVQLFENGVSISSTSDEEIRLKFDEIYSQLEKYDPIGYVESPNEYRIAFGEKSIETVLDSEGETWTVIYLSQDKGKDEPGRKIEKTDQLYTQLMNLVDTLKK